MARQITLGQLFASYEDFEVVLRRYSTDQNVLFKRVSSKSVVQANSVLEAGDTKFNEQLVYKYLTLKCKSGGYSRPTESQGIRPSQRTLNIQCPAQISLVAQRHPHQRLRISQINETHNHATTSNFVSLYPESRRLKNPEDVDLVEKLVQCRGQAIDIRDHVRTNLNVCMTVKDLANFRQKLKTSQRKGSTDEDDVSNEMQHLLANDPGSIVGIISAEPVDEDDPGSNSQVARLLDLLFFQTSQMRELFSKFGEILGMDTTYNVNKHNMHLIVFVVVDNHKNGRVVAYCFVRRETKPVIESAIANFAEANQEGIAKVQTVIVDKDYKEISGIRKILPHVHVHLCHTHVWRVLERQVNKLCKENQVEVKALLKKMSLSETPKVFQELYEELKIIASKELMTYFDSNWLNIEESWVLHVRNESLSLGVRSTNYNESINGKVKRVTNRCATLGDCIRGLLLLHKNREFESGYKDFLEQATISYIVNDKSPEWGARLLISELRQSETADSTSEEESVLENLSEDDTDSCNCTFIRMFNIKHCRHIFSKRRKSGKEILDKEMLPARWLRSTFQTDKEGQASTQSKPIPALVQRNQTPAPPKPMDRDKRYRKCLELCTEISSLVASTGGRQNANRMRLIENLVSIWLSGKEAIVLPMNSNGTIDIEYHSGTAEVEDQTDTNEIVAEIAETAEPEKSTDAVSEKCKDSPFHGVCKDCKGPAPRKTTMKQGSNHLRYYYACSQKCLQQRSFFRWYKCDQCGAIDVREGHFESQAESCDDLDQETPHVSLSSDSEQDKEQSNSEFPSLHVSLPRAKNTDLNISMSKLVEQEERELRADSLLNESISESEEKVDESDHDSCQNKSISEPELVEEEEVSSGDYNIDENISENGSVESEGAHSTSQQAAFPPFKLPIKETKGKSKKGCFLTDDNVQKRRDKAANIPNNAVTLTAPGVWLTKSQSQQHLTYTVVQKLERCGASACLTKEPPCSHMFSCTCEDFKRWHGPCKHVFKIYKDMLTNTSNEPVRRMSLLRPSGSEKNTSLSFSLPVHKIDGQPSKGRTKSFKKKRLNSCSVCKKEVLGGALCRVCKLPVHIESECSLPDPSLCKDGLPNQGERVCRSCICSNCRWPKLPAHTCMCVVCEEDHANDQCLNCCRAVHTECVFTELNWCFKCLHNKESCVSSASREILLSDEMLTDTIINQAQTLLQSQFPLITGLQHTIDQEASLTKYPKENEEHTTYTPCRKNAHHIQILYTGSNHWLTCFKKKGIENEIYVLNSSGSVSIGSFVEQQLALIMNTAQPSFKVTYYMVMMQEDTNECGPLAVAFATEIAFLGQHMYVEFTMKELRRHLLKCLLNGKMEPFPREGLPSPSDRLCFENVQVHCSCRLPEHFDRMASVCSQCQTLCHWKCQGLVAAPTKRRWLCNNCNVQKLK